MKLGTSVFFLAVSSAVCDGHVLMSFQPSDTFEQNAGNVTPS